MPEHADIYAALAAIKTELGNTIHAGTQGQYGAFANLKTVLAVEGVALKHGILAMQGPQITNDDKPLLVTNLWHLKSKDEIVYRYLLLPDKAGPQGLGAAETYARRRSYQTIFGLAPSEDDDPDVMRPGEQWKPTPVAPTPSVASGSSEAANYIVRVGKKFKGLRLGTIPLDEAINYAEWLKGDCRKSNKPLSHEANEYCDRVNQLRMEVEATEPGFAQLPEDEVPF